MLRLTSFILLSFSLGIPTLQGQVLTEINKLCDQVQVNYDYDLNFTASERRLMCGSSGIEAWEKIPLRQAQYHMQNFLEARGYHHPIFTFEAEHLFVDPGIPTLINTLRTQPPIEQLDIENYWLPRGKPLTPGELDTTEKWVDSKLGRLGYPCATIRSVGDPETGEVVVIVDKGPLWTIDAIEADPLPYVRGGMLDRYRAFEIGDPYDSMLLELSAERLKASDVVVNTQYIPLCRNEKPGTIRQMTLAGKPRLISFGFGFDTEELFITRASWRNSRFSETASSLDISATASYRRQNILTSFNWYYLPIPTRHYLKTFVRAERASEREAETLTLKGLVAPAWSREFRRFKGDFYLGPSLQFEATERGVGPPTTRLLTLDLGLSVESHMYEYYLASPRTGYQANLYASMSEKSAASDVSALTYRFDFTRLWNVLEMDPEIWIFGIRGNFSTTKPGTDTKPEELPLSFRYFLGGSDDLRGFARRSVHTGPTDVGNLTTAYLGSEIRLNNVIPYKLQPFLFGDWGWLGEQYFKLYPRMYWSPGVGLRWESPIGGLRFTLGHGYVAGKDKEEAKYLERWQFYFSLGEQF